MPDNFWQSFPFITDVSICLIPLLLISILIAIRVKNIQAGLRIFFLLAGFLFVFLVPIYILDQFLPKNVQQSLNTIVTWLSLIFICTTGTIYWINVRRGGSILENRPNPYSRVQVLYGILMLGTVFIGVFISGGDLPRGTYLFMLFAGLSFAQIFLSFQLREMGIIYRGRLIRFDHIQLLQWENMFKKEKVKIVMNSGKTMIIKIPWEMLTPLDNYIRNYFPRI